MSKNTKYIDLDARHIDEQLWDNICEAVDVPTKSGHLRVFTDFVIVLEDDGTIVERVSCCDYCECDKPLNFN